MSLGSHLAAIIAPLRLRITRMILAHRVRVRHPTLHADPTAIWDYGYHDLDTIEIGKNVSVGPFAEILVYRRSRHSKVPGRLILEDNAIVSMSADIRAAGGTIRIGENSGVGQHNVLVAANHQLRAGELHLASRGTRSAAASISARMSGSRRGAYSCLAALLATTRSSPRAAWCGGWCLPEKCGAAYRHARSASSAARANRRAVSQFEF